ncbi:MAG: zinc-dependent metalloprotease, partial [Singulisphaera sp.]
GEVISPIMAAKYRSGMLAPSELRRAGEATIAPGGTDLQLVPAEWGDAQALLHKRLSHGRMAGCEFNSGLRPEMTMAALALADAGKPADGGKIPEEFLGQMIKVVVMHEVGHSLGLRHNFHASTMLTAAQLGDTTITREGDSRGA